MGIKSPRREIDVQPEGPVPAYQPDSEPSEVEMPEPEKVPSERV